MRHGKINFVYLQRLSLKNTADTSARNEQRFGLFLCPLRCHYTPAVCKPRKASIMGVLVAVCGLKQREVAHRFFRAACLITHTKMATSKMKQSFVNMTKWSMRKMFEKFPEEEISLKELIDLLTLSWQEMIDDGEIEIKGGV